MYGECSICSFSTITPRSQYVLLAMASLKYAYTVPLPNDHNILRSFMLETSALLDQSRLHMDPIPATNRAINRARSLSATRRLRTICQAQVYFRMRGRIMKVYTHMRRIWYVHSPN